MKRPLLIAALVFALSGATTPRLMASQLVGAAAFVATTFGPLTTVAFIIYLWSFQPNKGLQSNRKKAVTKFIKENEARFVTDASRGSGESLDALADILGLPAKQRFAFFLDVQRNFSRIFPEQSQMTEVTAGKLMAVAKV